MLHTAQLRLLRLLNELCAHTQSKGGMGGKQGEGRAKGDWGGGVVGFVGRE